MDVVLSKKITSPTIIQGFPGFGLVGTIVTDFLIEHLNAQEVGEFTLDGVSPSIAIHKGKLIKPMGIYYSPKYNLIILHTLLNPKGNEWAIAEAVVKLAKKVNAKSIISIEGIMSPEDATENKLYYYGDIKLAKAGAESVKEGIIMGVTGAVLLKYPKVSCLFASSNLAMPDSKASAKIIEALDKHLGLKVDYKPLLTQAKEFEDKLKGIMQQSGKTKDAQPENKNQMSYLG